jgi:hypothetical protein
VLGDINDMDGLPRMAGAGQPGPKADFMTRGAPLIGGGRSICDPQGCDLLGFGTPEKIASAV